MTPLIPNDSEIDRLHQIASLWVLLLIGITLINVMNFLLTVRAIHCAGAVEFSIFEILFRFSRENRNMQTSCSLKGVFLKL